ncbi:MAG: molecular chaperone [Roseinatronobacter sp.]
MTASHPQSGAARDELDRARSEQYRFLSVLLFAAPDTERLSAIGGLQGDESALGQAFSGLAAAARATDAAQVAAEFFELFVGVGRGEILPYASFYQTGFLNERPLAELRGDLAALGVARAPGRYEPEDHIALVFEVMADMACGSLPVTPAQEAAFFGRHIAPWVAQFFDDLTLAPSARFYRSVAEIGRLLVDIEARAFQLAA